MKETIDLSANSHLEKFAGIVSDVFASFLLAVMSKEVTVTKSGAFFCDVSELVSGYEGQIHAVATEENSKGDVGILVNIQTATRLVDMMLGGDGESSDTVDEESLDAIVELGSQLLSGLNVPLETAISRKVNIKTTSAVLCSASANFNATKYAAFDFNAKSPDKAVTLRVFLSEEVINYINTGDKGSSSSASGGSGSTSSFGVGSPQSYGGVEYDGSTQNLGLLLDIDIPISVRMGTAKLFLKDILGLGPGNIVELEQNADEPIELVVNGKVIAIGEVVIIDGYFGFRIKEIISKADRIKNLKN